MMTPKEREVMQQALEALEELFHSNSTKVAVEKYNTAHNALLEALEQPNEIDWIETNKALAKEIIELKKQAEQEPVGYFAYDEEHDIWEELTGPNAPGATKLYANPVRTKDLTDDEIDKISVAIANAMPANMTVEDWKRSFARAVIAADREKNK